MLLTSYNRKVILRGSSVTPDKRSSLKIKEPGVKPALFKFMIIWFYLGNFLPADR